MPELKVTPLCPVFGRCGGCAYQDIPYTEELKEKEAWLRRLVARDLVSCVDKIEPIAASPREYHYRHRLDLKIIRSKTNEYFMGFSPSGRGKIVPVTSCAIAQEAVSNFLPSLKEAAIAKWSAKYKEANLVVRTGNDGRVLWGGIGRRSLQLKEEDYLWTEINGRKIFYSLDTFFQGNLSILPYLIEKMACLNFWDERPVLYDLYGGVGLFSLGLIDKVERAVLIEECPASIRVAKFNQAYHHLDHWQIIQGRVEKDFPPLLEKDPDAFSVVIIDPPRDGLSQEALSLLTQAQKINYLLYLSCNPDTLVGNLIDFTRAGWQIEKIIPFDFFPKTKHLETLTVLRHELTRITHELARIKKFVSIRV